MRGDVTAKFSGVTHGVSLQFWPVTLSVSLHFSGREVVTPNVPAKSVLEVFSRL